jgi:hypothetical protein
LILPGLELQPFYRPIGSLSLYPLSYLVSPNVVPFFIFVFNEETSNLGFGVGYDEYVFPDLQFPLLVANRCIFEEYNSRHWLGIAVIKSLLTLFLVMSRKL